MTGLTLYQLAGEFEQLSEALEALEGTTDEQLVQALYQRIDAASLALPEKADNVCALVAELKARAAARKAEADRLAARAEADKRGAKRLERALMLVLDAAGLKTIETPRFRASVCLNGGKVPVIREPCSKLDELPGDCVKTTVVEEPDLDAIRERLLAGESLTGFHLGQVGRHVRMR